MEIRPRHILKHLPGPILITGHTGFKGTWLTLMLKELGISCVGYSLRPQNDSLFSRLEMEGAIPEQFGNVCDFDRLLNFIQESQPTIILHLAAQPLVLNSYKEPRQTFSSNVMGTVNVLEAGTRTNSVKSIGIITTDKVYLNENGGKRFIESDPLRGKDPYSASKVGAEAAVAAWQQISNLTAGPRIFSLRAGNVIGGGDLGENRIIPDIVRGILNSEETTIRNPNSTRPWQHVLDPLYGYLLAVERSLEKFNFDALNFGPSDGSLQVNDVLSEFKNYFQGDFKFKLETNSKSRNMESVTLGLDSSLAETILGWIPKYSQREAIKITAEWWGQVINKGTNPKIVTKQQIYDFLSIQTSSK